MRSPTPITELQRQAAGRGSVNDDDLTNLVAQLVGAGVATRGCRQSGGRAASIRVHGRGPLSDLLVEALRCSGARIAHSSQPHAAVTSAAVDLVILADSLVADPRMVRDLHSRGVPHLPVRVRDGIGLVGPLVIPGVTSCLGCADLHRSDRDAAWPAIAAQLRDTVGVADRATLLATAALALSQVNRVIAAVRGQEAVPDPGPPPALNATLGIRSQRGLHRRAALDQTSLVLRARLTRVRLGGQPVPSSRKGPRHAGAGAFASTRRH